MFRINLILFSFALFSFNSYALPLQSGIITKEKIDGEYIVFSITVPKTKGLKRKIGKDLYLIQSDNGKDLFSYKKVYPNYAYSGEALMETSRGLIVSNSNGAHHKMIGTLEAWHETKGDPRIVVAITDNEFQLDHNNLKNSWWKNSNELPDNGIDDDDNGYVDDVFGYDFIEGDNNVDATYEGTHGTHISGIVAAQSDIIERSGIAPNVKIMPLRWFDYDLRWTTAVVVETYHYAAANGANIISSSYNVDAFVDDQAYRDTLKFLDQKGILIFNSAGNENRENPARVEIEELILVCSVKSGGEKKWDIKSSSSNYGSGIDICAPGDPIYSTSQGFGGNRSSYTSQRGTSMATPVAAAAAALIWSSDLSLSASEVKERLLSTADNIDDKNPKYKNKLGAGRVNINSAVK